mgnify:CR=1 FL=1
MIAFIKALFNKMKRQPYEIIYHPRHGYAAVYHNEVFEYVLNAAGMEACALRTAEFYPASLWSETTEEAGKRINLHANKRGMKTVWRG